MMKSRKEKTTRKRGLTSEEYIDILNESKPYIPDNPATTLCFQR